MNGLYKENKERFFAASNTKDGFVSYFEEIFGKDECDRVYILKGGPGCGKSTFMKKLGAFAEEKGFSCEYFHCSSDPHSLDGVIIKEKKIAVVDGTNPHAVEPSMAGAREIIINLGEGWDTDKLYQNKDEIKRLSDKKRSCYKNCYSCLYSKSVMDGLVYNLVVPTIYHDKLEKSAMKTAKNIFGAVGKTTDFLQKTRITEAFSSAGKIRLFTFENMADSCIFFKEPFPCSKIPQLYLKKVYESAKTVGAKTYVSYDSCNKDDLCALYFPEHGVSLSLYDEKAVEKCDRAFKKCKIINCARFVDTKSLSHTKHLRKFYSKLSENMEKQALDFLAEAGKTHEDTEKIYRQCTCYTTVENITNEYINKILKG